MMGVEFVEAKHVGGLQPLDEAYQQVCMQIYLAAKQISSTTATTISSTVEQLPRIVFLASSVLLIW